MQNRWIREMAKQSGCIDRRLTIGAMIVGRSDIRHLAKDLLDLQDGKIELSKITLSKKQVQIGKDIAKLVGPMWTAHEKGHPVGLKLPLLAFSPYYLLHNATGSTALNILNLPRRRNEIAAYLHETLCGAFIGNGKIFYQVLGFTIDQMADFLCHAPRPSSRAISTHFEP